jgi:hypothetical protein
MLRTAQLTYLEECGLCPVFASFTLAFALKLRKKHGKTSVMVAGECQVGTMKTKYEHKRNKVILMYGKVYDIGIVRSTFLVKLMCICYCMPYLRLVNVEFQSELLVPALQFAHDNLQTFGYIVLSVRL